MKSTHRTSGIAATRSTTPSNCTDPASTAATPPVSAAGHRVTSPDTDRGLTSFLYEEMAETLVASLGCIVPLLSPATRLKLLAFVQLLDKPEAVTADFAVGPSGALRLTLATDGGRPPAHAEMPRA